MSVQRIVEDTPHIELIAEAQHKAGVVETPVSTDFHLCQIASGNIDMMFSLADLADLK